MDLSDLPVLRPEFASKINTSIIRDYKLADRQYELIMEAIADYEKGLDDSHEVALYLASFGQSILMSVERIGYANPSLIYFHGIVNGRHSTLI